MSVLDVKNTPLVVDSNPLDESSLIVYGHMIICEGNDPSRPILLKPGVSKLQ